MWKLKLLTKGDTYVVIYEQLSYFKSWLVLSKFVLNFYQRNLRHNKIYLKKKYSR